MTLPIVAYQDESGSLTDPYAEVILVALLITTNPQSLKPVLPRIRKWMNLGRRPRRKFTAELDALNWAIERYLGQGLSIEHQDSQLSSGSGLVDHVVGTLRVAALGGEHAWLREEIEDIILSEEKISWKELSEGYFRALRESGEKRR
jgi:hypothetical protein